MSYRAQEVLESYIYYFAVAEKFLVTYKLA